MTKLKSINLEHGGKIIQSISIFLSLCIGQHTFDVIFKEAVYDRTMQTSMDGSMMKFDNTLYK